MRYHKNSFIFVISMVNLVGIDVYLLYLIPIYSFRRCDAGAASRGIGQTFYDREYFNSIPITALDYIIA